VPYPAHNQATSEISDSSLNVNNNAEDLSQMAQKSAELVNKFKV